MLHPPSADTIETNFNFAGHSSATTLRQKGVTSRGGWKTGRRRFVYMYRKAQLRRILLVALPLGRAASFLSGPLTSLSPATA
jgi:hypothetical protein